MSSTTSKYFKKTSQNQKPINSNCMDVSDKRVTQSLFPEPIEISDNSSSDDDIFEVPKFGSNNTDFTSKTLGVAKNQHLIDTNKFILAPECRKFLKQRYKLLYRTDSQRQQILDSKISEILVESKRNEKSILLEEVKEPKHRTITDKVCPTNCLFEKNSGVVTSENIYQFFVEELKACIDFKDISLPGYLLRDWRSICGRDLSPDRNVV